MGNRPSRPPPLFSLEIATLNHFFSREIAVRVYIYICMALKLAVVWRRKVAVFFREFGGISSCFKSRKPLICFPQSKKEKKWPKQAFAGGHI